MSVLLPDCVFALPMFFDVSSSLTLVVEFVLPVFQLFSVLSSCICGTRGA